MVLQCPRSTPELILNKYEINIEGLHMVTCWKDLVKWPMPYWVLQYVCQISWFSKPYFLNSLGLVMFKVTNVFTWQILVSPSGAGSHLYLVSQILNFDNGNRTEWSR